jgi:carboxypeptidase C (cathepsin A)
MVPQVGDLARGKRTDLVSYDSWASLTNMVYNEQSVSTGFSQRTINVTNEVDVAD